MSLLKAGTQQGQQHLHMGQPCRHVAAVLQGHSGHQLPAWPSGHSLAAELGSSLCSPSSAAAPAPARPTPRPSAAKARATTSPPTSPGVAMCGAVWAGTVLTGGSSFLPGGPFQTHQPQWMSPSIAAGLHEPHTSLPQGEGRQCPRGNVVQGRKAGRKLSYGPVDARDLMGLVQSPESSCSGGSR